MPEPEPGETLTRPAPKRFLPEATPETRHFWEGTRVGELRLQRCADCDRAYFPPRPFCPSCGKREVETFRASGRGRLFSYVISHRAAPGFEAPYSIAVVELEEGPRMMTNVVECAQTPEALRLDMPVEVVFSEQSDEITLPLFRPTSGATEGR